MATIATLAWLFSFLLLIPASIRLHRLLENRDVRDAAIYAYIFFLMGHVVVAVIISTAVLYDININLLNSSETTLLSAGVVNLGLAAIVSFFVPSQNFNHTRPYQTNQNFEKGVSIKFILEIISLIASILGIIGFYIEYLM